ncbi:MAG: two-component regulator propeller domain-containing protein [Bacteroidales bacterium]|nr:two-component regulator propeller domain-containing protein [Bacteroidales bacterium]
MKYLLTLFASLALATASAQQETSIHEWRDHLPYNRGVQVINTGNTVYSATRYGLFSYDKSYESVTRYNKVNGLSDSEIADIGFSTSLQTLVVAYTNTNIDLMVGGKVINLSDIKRKNILGNKTINKVTVDNQYAYLACGFGIVVVDMARHEIHDTYIIGDNGSMVDVQDVVLSPQKIYALTTQGVYEANRQGTILALYQSWNKINTLPHPDLAYSAGAWFADRLVAAQANDAYNDDTVWIYNPATQTAQKMASSTYSNCYRIQNAGDNLAISYEGNVDLLNNSFQSLYLIYKPSNVYLQPSACSMEGTQTAWIADRRYGLVKVTGQGWTGEFIAPQGPYSQKVYDLSTHGNNLWIAAGGRSSVWGNLYIRDGISNLDGNTWKTFNHTTQPAMASVWDVVAVKTAPSSGKTYAATWGMGVLEITDGQITNQFDTTNSSLEPWLANPTQTNISGVNFDAEGNLWVANTGASSLLHKMTPSGQWTAYNLGGSMSGIDIGNLIVDQYNQKWVMMRKDHSIMVFNENNEPSKRARILNEVSGNGAIPGNKVYALCEDLDGEVWIGTDAGIAVFYNPGAVLTGTSNFDAQRIVVSLGGYNQYLLENETVTSIQVDGANQKWIGTDRAGAFLLSADGTEEIFHFTAENSPLFSNSIIDIAIADDGTVYFATPNGIVSFKGEATPPQPSNDNLTVYPQPVPQGYEGVVAIKGVTGNAWVKITTISGNLVYETRAQGGQAIWNAKTMDGEKVSTGVYLVFITNDDGTETAVTKIMVVK